MDNRMKSLMANYGEDLIDFLKMRLDRVKSFGLKGKDSFETTYNVGEVEGRRKEIQEIINYLENIWRC